MRRNITVKLVEWKNQPNRKPLILRGARQVGKSWSITDFGRKHFEGTLHIVNLEKQLVRSNCIIGRETAKIVMQKSIIWQLKMEKLFLSK